MLKEEEKLKACALRLLARREHSRYELRQKLLQRKFPLELIENLINNLEERGWQSNDRFAQSYLSSQISRGYGPLKIQDNFRKRGLDKDFIAQVAALDPQIWQDSLARLWQRKYQAALEQGKPIPREQQQRFLQSRGFTYEQISTFLEKQ